MPRGRLPGGEVETTSCVSPLITVRSPEASLVTYTRTLGGGGGAGAAAGAAAGASDFGASWLHAAAAITIATTGTTGMRNKYVGVFMLRMIPQYDARFRSRACT